MQCPIARTLERVGEWWSMLILRDAMLGMTRFEQFQKSLGISPNILSARLATLVEHGFLERRMYSVSPPRMEYTLTDRGHAFESILLAFAHFGNQHFASDGLASVVVRRDIGRLVDVGIVDRESGEEITYPEYILAAGPVAGEEMVEKMRFAEEVIRRRLEAEAASKVAVKE